MEVDGKAWPKFDGAVPLDNFLTKVEYFMHITDMPECEKTLNLI